MQINGHVANNLGEMVPGSFVLPSNPFYPNQGRYQARLGEFMPGSFPLPHNPIVQAMLSPDVTKPLPIKGTAEQVLGIGGLGCGGSGACSCGCDDGSGLGAVDIESVLASTGQYWNDAKSNLGTVMGFPVLYLLVGGVGLFWIMSKRDGDTRWTRARARAAKIRRAATA